MDLQKRRTELSEQLQKARNQHENLTNQRSKVYDSMQQLMGAIAMIDEQLNPKEKENPSEEKKAKTAKK